MGADVREEHRVQAVDLSDPSGVTVRVTDAAGTETDHHARFVIDGSGRDALIGTKNGWRTPREALDRTALWSHWKGVTMNGGLEEGLSLIIYMG